LKAFWALACVALLAGCGRLVDVIAYETSIKRVTVADQRLPTYDTRPVDDTLQSRLHTAGFTGFLHLNDKGQVFEWYRPGFSKTRPANVKSVSKSLFSALVGQSATEVDAPIPSFAGCDVPPDLAPLTLAQLLNMTAGFAFTENVSSGVYAAPSWGCAAMALPVEARSGERFNYNTLQYHLAGLHLSETLGGDIAHLMQDDVFAPMGIALDGWVVSPDGDVFTGSEMRLHPRDMLRFGHVMVQDGIWNTRQVLSPRWIRRTRQPVRQDTGRANITYGWGWWQTWLAGQAVQFAEGYGGQAIVLAPATGEVFVFTAPTGGLVSGQTHDARVDSLLAIVADQLARPHALSDF